MQPLTRIVGNESITTDQDGGVTPVIDQLWGVRNQSLALDSYREPATSFLDNYTQAENVTLPLAYGSPSGTPPRLHKFALLMYPYKQGWVGCVCIIRTHLCYSDHEQTLVWGYVLLRMSLSS